MNFSPKAAEIMGLKCAVLLHFLVFEEGIGLCPGTLRFVNYYRNLEKELPFWKEKTIKNIFLSLQTQGFVQLNMDEENWEEIKSYCIYMDKVREAL